MTGIAIKLKQSKQKANSEHYPVLLGTVKCDICGDEFGLATDPSHSDLGKKYASFVEEVLGRNHKQGESHPDSIQMPKTFEL